MKAIFEFFLKIFGMKHTKKVAGVLALAATLLTGYEGYSNRAYLDGGGIATICYGETVGVHMGQVKTRDECDRLLAQELVGYKTGMDKYIKVSVPDASETAFLTFTYNIGVGAWSKSTVVKKLNAGDLKGACNYMYKYVYVKGQYSSGLKNRRDKEVAQCLLGVK